MLPPQIKELAEIIKDENSLIILGKELGEVSAKEAALKMKEVTYIHSEAFSFGEFKHGPLALLDSTKSPPVVCMIFDDEHFMANLNSMKQLKAQCVTARLIAITDCPEKIPQDLLFSTIEIPSSGPLTALLAVIPMQLLALYTG